MPGGVPKRYVTPIDDSNVAAGAGIASSKLADGANFLKKDGTVPMTADFDAGSQKVKNVATATNPNDATNLAQVQALIAALNSLFASKGAAVAASTANVTISNPGTASFDGVTVTTGQRILLKNQTAQAENGLYIFNTSGTALVRDTEMDAWAEVPGALVSVEAGGAANGSTIWLCTAAATGTLGTTAITWMNIPTTGLTNSNFVDNETPSGSVNGSNVTFTLANTPITGSVQLYNGNVRMIPTTDYTISGATITMVVAPLTGEALSAYYRK